MEHLILPQAIALAAKQATVWVRVSRDLPKSKVVIG
jgi:hypothetical protein